jgi:cell division protein FtsN
MAQQRRSNRGKNGRGASRQDQAPPGGRGFRAYVAGLASGLFLAFIVYLVTLPPETGGDRADQPKPAASPAAPAPEYEFYTVLPNQEITVDVDPADMPKPRSESSAKQYLLQAGSFRESEDADRRRAELLLLGLTPRVEETHGDTGRWYRVVLGPFESRSAMARARGLTAQQDIDTLLVQRSPD